MDIAPFFRGRATEVIVTTADESGRANAAPMGVRRDGGTYHIAVFSPTATAANARRAGRLAANFTCDASLWARATAGRMGQDAFERPDGWGVPVLRDAHARVLFACAPAGGRCLDLRPLDAWRGAGPVAQVNRGFNALIEAAVLATRMELVPPAAARARFEQLRQLGEGCGDSNVLDAFEMISAFFSD